MFVLIYEHINWPFMDLYVTLTFGNICSNLTTGTTMGTILVNSVCLPIQNAFWYNLAVV